jgi:hypothetical protein
VLIFEVSNKKRQLMKKIALIVLVLFGIGLSTPISASDTPPVEKVSLCSGNVINNRPCPLRVCINYIDCAGLPKTTCIVVGPASVTPFNAFTGGCCSTIVGINVQFVSAPPAPISPTIGPGATAVYATGKLPPCDLMTLDFAGSLPNFVIF